MTDEAKDVWFFTVREVNVYRVRFNEPVEREQASELWWNGDYENDSRTDQEIEEVLDIE